MRTALRWAALAAILLTVALWLLAGRNLGWTKTSVPVKKIEEGTNIPYTDWEKRFLPGVDFVAAGLAAGAVLFGAGFVFRKEPRRDAREDSD